MMDDNLDVSISHGLKNWVASQPLPAGGRQRLLKAAAAGPETHDRTTYQPSLWQKFSTSTTAYPIHGDRYLGPLSQSRFWSFHLVISQRLAT